MHIMKLKAGDVKNVLEEASRDHESKVGTIDPSRTHLNYNLAQTERCQTADQIKERIRSLGVKRKIKEDAVLACSVLIDVPADYTGSVTDFMESAFKALTDELCDGDTRRVLQADVHMDEKTPHMHFAYIPIVEKDGKAKLSAKELLTLKKLQEFHPHISERMTEDLGMPILLWNEEKCAERRKKRVEGDRSADYVSIEQYKAEQERKSYLNSLEGDIEITEQTLNDQQKGLEYVQGLLRQADEELARKNAENARLDAELAQKDAENVRLGAENDDLKQENTDLKEENAAGRRVLAKMQNKYNDMLGKNAVLEAENAKLRAEETAIKHSVNDIITPLIEGINRRMERLRIVVCRVKDEVMNSLLNTRLDKYAVITFGAMASVQQSLYDGKRINNEDVLALKAVNKGLDEVEEKIEEYSRD